VHDNSIVVCNEGLSSRSPINPDGSNTNDKTRRVLQNLGLTDYEIKVYLALLDTPASPASDISRVAEVPVSKIYEVLANLERKGWVESQASARPARYYPKSPSTALQGVRIRTERELKSNEEYLLQELMPRYSRKEAQEKPEIWIVRGEYNILAKVQETIDRCKKEILVVVPSALNDVIDLVIPALTEINSAGVSVRIMISSQANIESLEKISKLSQLRLKENMFGGGVISDAKEIILLLGGGREGVADSSGSALAIWSDHAGLASFAKNYFDFLWNEATPFENTSQTKR
jgi:HTH-type transcriptional regulator, sugar sensing transcriptional regulator